MTTTPPAPGLRPIRSPHLQHGHRRPGERLRLRPGPDDGGLRRDPFRQADPPAVDPLPGARERALAFGADIALDPAAGDFAEQIQVATAAVLGRNGALILLGITPKPLTTSAGLTFSYQG
ncbi:hypothetical protein GCM10010149_91950 [Nonomuraea roseoviolacea subsp. roseoviolacea]|uniref:hypothetical protein n=1 Tax=Nonomuraea roseoviolacea TaxID=103837 RepID=UPI0031D83C90